MSDIVTLKGWVVLQKVIRKDPKTGGAVALFAPVRVTSTIVDADSFIMLESKNDIVKAKSNFRRLEVPIDLSLKILAEINNSSGVNMGAYAGAIKPSGTILLGKPKTE